jgi:hypothetical protein
MIVAVACRRVQDAQEIPRQQLGSIAEDRSALPPARSADHRLDALVATGVLASHRSTEERA